MSRGLDHLVLCVNDLTSAADLYRRLGFTLTPPADHPFGTGNVIAQLAGGSFLEVLAVTRPALIAEPADGAFSFAAFNQDFLQARQGMSMLVLDSTDEAADRADFQRRGLHVYPPFEFQRQAVLPGGETATVGFSLTFTGDPALPGMGFFTCRQWRPDLFWKPDYQRHANTAHGLGAVLVCTPAPDAAAKFLSAFAASPAEPAGDGRITIRTRRGRIEIFSPAALHAAYPGAFAGAITATPFFAGYEIGCADPDAAGDLWTANGLAPTRGAAGPWLTPGAALGCIVAAVPAA